MVLLERRTERSLRERNRDRFEDYFQRISKLELAVVEWIGLCQDGNNW